MAAIVNARAMNHLGAVVQAIRPQWGAPGIRKALERALADHPYPDVALTAVTSARDPKAATPAVIPTRCANGWMETLTSTNTAQPATPAPPATASLRCPDCGLLNVEGDAHRCGPLATPEATHEFAAQARSAIRKPPPTKAPDNGDKATPGDTEEHQGTPGNSNDESDTDDLGTRP